MRLSSAIGDGWPWEAIGEALQLVAGPVCSGIRLATHIAGEPGYSNVREEGSEPTDAQLRASVEARALQLGA